MTDMNELQKMKAALDEAKEKITKAEASHDSLSSQFNEAVAELKNEYGITPDEIDGKIAEYEQKISEEYEQLRQQIPWDIIENNKL